MESKFKEEVGLIREVFTYSKRFRGATFVFRIDSDLLDEPMFPALIRDIALLHGSGIRTVLVVGAQSQIDEVLKRYGIGYEFAHGVRISSDEAIQFIKMAAFDVSNRVMTLLSSLKINALIGNWVKARSMGVRGGQDFKKTGVVKRVETELLTKVLEEGLIPLFPCIGWSGAGTPYNISSAELAYCVSVQLRADKLFFLNSFDGLGSSGLAVPQSAHITEDGRISRLSSAGAVELLQSNMESENPNFEYIGYAVKACEGGVKRCHILDGRHDGVILKEIFSGLGSGIMIDGNTYESVRKMRPEDVTDIFRIMAPLAEEGILLKRSEREVLEQCEDYYVYEIDNTIHGCAALHSYGGGYGEIAAIAVDSSYAHLGIGRKLVSHIMEEARSSDFHRLFALTTQAIDWFEELGFCEGTIEDLPEKKKLLYDRKRNSKIVMKKL